jgi:hypothetical protein
MKMTSNNEVTDIVKLNYEYFCVLYQWLKNIRRKVLLQDKAEHPNKKVEFYFDNIEDFPSKKVSFGFLMQEIE